MQDLFGFQLIPNTLDIVNLTPPEGVCVCLCVCGCKQGIFGPIVGSRHLELARVVCATCDLLCQSLLKPPEQCEIQDGGGGRWVGGWWFGGWWFVGGG